MEDVLEIVMIIIGLSVAVVLLTAAVVIPIGSAECHGYATMNTKYEYKYRVFPGCMVNYNGTWINASNINAVMLDKE
jgi:hypothetical protein